MKILILSFYYEPDLSAGSFRTIALVNELKKNKDYQIEVISTLPNRYAAFEKQASLIESDDNTVINRVSLPNHKSGMLDQAKAFITYYKSVINLVKGKKYDMVYATSSRLFTAFLGARIANKAQIPLYLDIRDIFVDTIKDVLSPKISMFAKPVFSLIEKYTFNSASRINLVSKGFEGYFTKRYPNQQLRWFTNGIDSEFLNEPVELIRNYKNECPEVLYAGNIGEGQGLHKVIPELAKRLEGEAKFKIIGDGGRKDMLQSKLKEFNLSNVELCTPVERTELIEQYKKSDILFLHLNDFPAFEKVLPSKIFEYAAVGKPIWAGVSGYAKKFIAEEVVNSAIFNPLDIEQAISAYKALELSTEYRREFVEKFSRKNIMSKMAEDIVEFSKLGGEG